MFPEQRYAVSGSVITGVHCSTSYMSHGVALRSQSVALSWESLLPTMHSMGAVMCLVPCQYCAIASLYIECTVYKFTHTTAHPHQPSPPQHGHRFRHFLDPRPTCPESRQSSRPPGQLPDHESKEHHLLALPHLHPLRPPPRLDTPT